MAEQDSTTKITPEEQRILDRFDVIILPLTSFIEIIEDDEDHANMATVLKAIERDIHHSMKHFIDRGHEAQAAPEGGAA